MIRKKPILLLIVVRARVRVSRESRARLVRGKAALRARGEPHAAKPHHVAARGKAAYNLVLLNDQS